MWKQRLRTAVNFKDASSRRTREAIEAVRAEVCALGGFFPWLGAILAYSREKRGWHRVHFRRALSHPSCGRLACPAVLIGPKTHQRIRLELRGQVETFSILFQPTGLQRLFSLPGGVIVNEHYEADTVLGRAMAQLWSQLGEAKTFEQRAQIAHTYLTARIPRVCEQSCVDAAVQEMISKRGCIRVAELARDTGIGLRQFERRFMHDLGISPKVFTRIVRFEAAIQKKAAFPSFTWTQIAHELSYHDQMHMIHDFHLLSDENPASLAPHLAFLSSITG